MPLVTVDELGDPRLNPYRDLPQSNRTRNSGRFIAEGLWLVERLAASPFKMESMLIDASQVQRLDSLPENAVRETPVYVLPAGLVEQLVGFKFHRGVLGCGRRRPAPALEEILPPPPRAAIVVVCLDVVDPTNLGGLVRNAAAFGASAVMVNRGSADPFSRRVIRVSMGAVLQLPIVEIDNPQSELAEVRDRFQFQLVGAVLDEQAEPLERMQRIARAALLFGNEGYGLDERWLAECSHRVTLRMTGRVDSLNVTVASGVFLYHFMRMANAS